MARPGPAPVPTIKLEKRGSWLAKTRDGEPDVEEGTPRCPKGLDKIARKCWAETVPRLAAMHVLTKDDRNTLIRYCQTWSRYSRAIDYLTEHGEICTKIDKEGNTVYTAHPQVGIAQKDSLALLRIEQEFGMTPSARTRVRVIRPKGDDGKKSKKRFFKSG